MSSPLAAQQRAAALSGVNADYIDQLYEAFKADPDSVSPEWRNYFYGFEHGGLDGSPSNSGTALAGPTADPQTAAQRMILAYRLMGHLAATLDPLEIEQPESPPELEPGYYGLEERDLDNEIALVSVDAERALPLREIVSILRRVYCGTVATEHMHITSADERRWIEQRLESTHGDWQGQHTDEQRRAILWDLTAAEGLEHHLHRRYVGQKRFSLEGGDSLITLLDELIQGGGARDITDVVIGMAHRGRLNVLVNILGKPPEELFAEFEGRLDLEGQEGSGDVKYHQGFYSDILTYSGPVHVSLAFNPSHLEIVAPVVEGGVRARQDRHRSDPDGVSGKGKVLPVLIHGDAAFAGQGVVTETLNLSQTPGYGTGGSVHIVINNQIGFTTSLPHEARSTRYCTEVAKLVQAPIFHVNADDPDAVRFVTQLALDYRRTFHKDVVIDLVCYRRQGHNEADEPMMTQPVMYQRIREMETTRAIYARRLVRQGVLSQEEADAMINRYREAMDKGDPIVREFIKGSSSGYEAHWEQYFNARPGERVDTQLTPEAIARLGERLTTLPRGFTPQRRVGKVIEERRRMLAGEVPIDWGMAESLAYASLLEEGFAVRLSGQDSQRGTFAHRHAVVHDETNGNIHTPLKNITEDQPRFEVINSLLSELAVLGFEYGYATSSPNTLVLWEAQFGDFANCAQPVIDQFVSSGFLKWGRLCQLTMLLPHGFEGQGPEHSSARLERFLQLCAELNMRVFVPTTPAQFFHLLRDQMKRKFRRPLVVMTPKSLLRLPASKSQLSAFTDGKLALVQPEIDEQDLSRVRRVVACSGKVYFDLLRTRREREIDDIAIIRIEQLYPFPRRTLAKILSRYTQATELVWCQEEPRNQGAWYQIQHHLRVARPKGSTLGYAGRAPSASPACGYAKLHAMQQQALVDVALSPDPVDDPGERLEDTDMHGYLWAQHDEPGI